MAMHIAATSPQYISRIRFRLRHRKRKRNLSNSAQDAKKPEKVIEKIIEGKLERFFAEVCLLSRPISKIPM